MKRTITILSLMALTGWVSAQPTTVWNPAANASSDGAWSDAANWTAGLPDNTFKAVFNVPDAMDSVVDGAASAGRIVSGDNGPGGRLIVADGGNLTVGDLDWTAVGYNNTSTMVIESGGTASFAHHLWIGFAGGADGTFTMNGGNVSVTGMTGLGWDGGKGTANINGGTLNLAQFHPENSIKGQSVLDIGAGTVIIAGDHVSVVNTYVNSGKILAYSGGGTIQVDFDTTNPGATTITAEEGEPQPSQTTWDPANNPESDGTWGQAANWTGGVRPGNASRVDFNISGASDCTVDSVAAADRIVMGEGGPGGSLIVASGSALLVGKGDWSAIGVDNSAVLQVSSYATASFGNDLRVGYSSGGNGTLQISDADVSVAGLFTLGSNGGQGTVQITGGTLTIADPGVNDWIQGNSVLNVSGPGKVVVSGNHSVSVQNYVSAGKITANGGNTVFHSYDSGENETTIAAEYIPPVQTVWEPNAIANSDGMWSTAENWRDGIPGDITKVVFNVSGSPDCTVDGSALAGRVVLGDGQFGGNLSVANGGNLSVGNVDWTGIGWTSDTESELLVEAGASASFGHHLWIGFNPGAVGKVTITGGTVSVAQMTGLGWNGGKGTVNVSGGTMNLAQFHPDNSIKGESVMDVSGTGKVVISGNHYTSIANYVANGKIKSNGGSNVIFYYDSATNETVISGTMPVDVPPHQLTGLDVNKEGGEMTLTFRTIVGQTYHVESTPSLSPANWTTVSGTTVTATEPWTTFTLPIGSTDNLYYQSALE